MTTELRKRLLAASPPQGHAPIGAIRDRVRRRQRRRRLFVASGGIAAALVVVVLAGTVFGGDVVRVGTSGGQVQVPDVTGLPLRDAKAALRRAGLEGSVASGYRERDGRQIAWSDPDGPSAVVAAQEPPAGIGVPKGSVVGLRTGTFNRNLCSVFNEIPPRRGDAVDLASSPGFFDMLRGARPHAEGQLADAIDQLLTHHDAGGSPASAPGPALDGVATQHDACARADALGERGGSRSESFPPPDGFRFCPHARHPFEFPPAADESGDGLPASGSSTRAAAEGVAADRGVIAAYGADDAHVSEVAGRAWRRSGTGRIEIVSEQLFVVDLVLSDSSRCPQMPAFKDVPLRFLYREGT